MAGSRLNSERILELDVLRGLAALCVVCTHYTTTYSKEYFPAYPMPIDLPYGGYGVDLFFMISGFVIFMTLEKTGKPLDFVVSRFSRLYPAYWFAVILTFISIRAFQLSLPLGQASFREALVNLTMFHEWFGVRDVDRVYWTLSVELSFYILMLIVFINKGLKYIESLGIFWLVLMVIVSRLFWYAHIHIPMIIKQSRMLSFGHLFFAGILFYQLRIKGDSWQRYAGLALCLATGYLVRKYALDIYFEAGCFIIFFLFIKGYLSRITIKPLVFLGTISYSLYLIHEYIGYIIIRHLYSINANGWLCFFIPLMCTILIAAAMTFGIEQPAIKIIRQQYAQFKK